MTAQSTFAQGLQQTQLASNYAAGVYAQQQEAIAALYAHDRFMAVWDKAQFKHAIDVALQAECDAGQHSHTLSEQAWMRAVRRLRARMMFRFIWRDANTLCSVMQLTQELSYFADACIEAASDYAYAQLQPKYGEPLSEAGQRQQLIVIAMGKLGAYELNLSSDIDLIFCFDENGETNGSKSISVQQFCILWGQMLIKLLDQPTEDGFVFRVDMRLRPWGDGSPLAISYRALEIYLEKHGRDWERYAWIKARAVTGGQEAELLLKMSQAFVYRLYADYTAFAALRDMKAMIEREVERRKLDDDVKLSKGGIREIEFVVQAFQLIYGGARKNLRVSACLDALQALVDDGLMQQDAADDLHYAYLFLRRLEHAIQAMNDAHTQQLPALPEAQERIARVMGYADYAALLHVLAQHKQHVRREFDRLIADRSANAPHKVDAEVNAGFANSVGEEGQAIITNFMHSKAVVRLPQDAAVRLQQLLPLIKETLVDLGLELPQAVALCTRVVKLLEATTRRSVYWQMLLEQQPCIRRLLLILSSSPWIAEELTRYPVLLDEFLSLNDSVLPTKEDLTHQLRQQLLRVEVNDAEGQMRTLRLFKKGAVLAVAASDVIADRPLMKVSDALTDIAEVVLHKAFYLAFNAIAEKHGYPATLDGQRVRIDQPAFAIVGYGKLGGIEMSYGSDLDVVFLHSVDEQTYTDGAKSISGAEFVAKVAQKIMSLLTTQTLDGRVYEIDTRLRPSGHSGMLVSSIAGFKSYQEKSAWVWEHQALVRARGIAGDTTVLAAFNDIRRSILCMPRDALLTLQEVRQMRQKMLDHLGSSQNDQKNDVFHLKQDKGGIVDIEFVAQYCVLIWGHTFPQITQYSDNVRLLQDIASAGCITKQDAAHLIDAYLAERAETHRLALAQQPITVSARAWRTTRELVRRQWDNIMQEPYPTLVDENT